MDTTRHDSRHDLASLARMAMAQHGLQPEFSREAIAELARIEAPSPPSPGATDLTGMLWCSIDNDDSRDLDQLTVAEPLADGGARILVAIADVDALVKKGSAIDAHARANTTSVYTAARIFPMLPEKLSTDLTSLAAGEKRLAMVADMKVAADGVIGESRHYPAMVLNQAKLAYNALSAWLEGTGPLPQAAASVRGLDEVLRLQDRVALAMRRKRQEHGALRLETIEARPVYDNDRLVDMRPDPRNRAKDLIEDFMIAANVATAEFLSKENFPTIRRVLVVPRRWDRIVYLAAGYGKKLPREPSAEALDAFLEDRRIHDPDHFPDISLSIVKMLGSGEYQLELPGKGGAGHFGLSLRDYTHSTAPNRRYPDLITQRLLKAALAGTPVPYGNDELAALAAHCTLQEDNADKVERQIRKSAAALILASRIGSRYEAIVTGASEKGTWVRISGPTAEGKLVRGFEGLDVGDRVRVELIHTDIERGFIDFARAPERR
jgi:exoribonuclease-2